MELLNTFSHRSTFQDAMLSLKEGLVYMIFYNEDHKFVLKTEE